MNCALLNGFFWPMQVAAPAVFTYGLRGEEKIREELQRDIERIVRLKAGIADQYSDESPQLQIRYQSLDASIADLKRRIEIL